MSIIRVWLYKSVQVPSAGPDSVTKQRTFATRVVYGEFKYYRVDNGEVSECHRRDANAYAERMGQPIQLFLGYPDFMIDLGYRV